MLDFIIQNFNKKCCKKNQPKQLCSQQNATVPVETGTVVEIDYEKLVNAIVDANQIIEKEKEEKELKQKEEEQIAWKTLLLRGKNKEPVTKDTHVSDWQKYRGLKKLKKKDVSSNRITYSLIKTGNCFMLSIYRIICFSLALISGLIGILYLFATFILNQQLSTYIGVSIPISMIFGTMSLMIKITKFEAEQTNDTQTIMSLFNALTAFTAMIFSIIAVIVSIIAIIVTQGGN